MLVALENQVMSILTNQIIGSNYITSTVQFVNNSKEVDIHKVIVGVEQQLLVLMVYQLINPELHSHGVDVIHQGVYRTAVQVAIKLMTQLFIVVESYEQKLN